MNIEDMEIFKYIDSCNDQMMALWKDIVTIESPSKSHGGVNQMASYLSLYCSALGLQYKKYMYDNAGPSLSVFTKKRKLPAIALMAHMDTVHAKGTFGNKLFVEKDGNVYGPGVYDCKGGIVISILAIKALEQIGYDKRQIKLLLAGDEEVAHSLSDSKSVELYTKEIPGCACAFNCESGMLNGNVVIKRKGGGILGVSVTGVESHAGLAPKEGSSAILAAASQIMSIEKLNDYEKGLYFNCGKISGGTEVNVIPGKCKYEIGIRFPKNSDFDDAISNIHKICDNVSDSRIKTEISVRAGFKAMEPNEKTYSLLKMYQDACTGLGYPEPQGLAVSGCSDGAYVSMLGVPVLCGLGARGEFNHSKKEYAVISSIAEQAKKIVQCILCMDDNF